MRILIIIPLSLFFFIFTPSFPLAEEVNQISKSGTEIQACSGSTTDTNQPLSEQASLFFSGLFSTDQWPPRWYCGEWTSFHGWLSILSDALIWISYFAIPTILFFFLYKKKVPTEFKYIFTLFIAFILFCGLTHLMEVVIFWWPAYHLSTILKLFTAIVSGSTVFALIKVMPLALKYRSPKETLNLISELKSSSEELIKSEARFRQLLESTPDAMVIVNKEGKIVFVNTQTERLFGYSNTELENQYVEILMPAGLAQKHQTHRNNYNKAPKTRMMGEGRELLGTRKNGQDFPVEISLNPIDTGEEVLVAAGIRDITKKKKVERTIKQLNQSLEEQVKRRTKLLTNKTEELERSNKEMEHFAFLASHDLKAPLTNIESLINLMESQNMVTKEGKPIIDKLNQTIKGSKEKLESINYAISIKNRNDIIVENTNLKNALDHVITLIGDMIENTNTKLEISIPEGLKVHFPTVYVQTVLQNLISNAIKYKHPNRSPIINISATQEKDSIALLIKDNGRGIDLDTYGGKIFGLFQRFHFDVEGKGMGLYITKSIIENYGGSIEVESILDKGTSFKIKLPLDY